MKGSKSVYQLSATELISMIKSKNISVREVCQSILQRIDEINPQTNAWVCWNSSKTLKIADDFDKKISNGENIGPLYGIPVGIKDIFNTENFPTQMGSSQWKNFTPGNDARVVHYLIKNNAIIIGKTDTAEFAVHALGKTVNPYDANRTPGTSSSGSAVAVATCMIPFALGTQTAGSIIRPASYCGVYGFKPSFGLLPRTGMLKTTDSLDQIGYFTRTQQDLELFFDVIRVKGKNFPLSEEALNDNKRQSVINRPWKIKFVKSLVWDQAEIYAQKHIQDFVKKITEDPSFQVEELILPKEFSLAHKMHQIIYAVSLGYYFRDELKNKSLVSDVFYDLATQAKKISTEQFHDALEYQSKIRNILDDLFKEFDIILSLSTCGHAPLINEREKDDPSLIWTMCGNPAISMPAIKTKNELPMGIQAISRRYNDKLLLNFVNLLHKKNFIYDAPYPPVK